MASFDDRVAQRRKNFKKGTDAEEVRRKREDEAVQLRKQKREEALQKKRQVDDTGEFQLSSGIENAELVAMIQALHSTDEQVVFTAVQQFRKMLSVEKDPPIQQVINLGNAVPKFVELLRDSTRPQLQFEAAWVLTNIASGNADQTRVVVEMGALPLFVGLLTSTSDEVKEQAVWALGNIAGDSTKYRDLVLKSDGLAPLLAVFRETDKTSMMRNATWTLSNLCRGKPPPPFEWVSPALAPLANLVYSPDYEVLADACWALSYLSDGPNERIAAVINAGVCRRLVDLLHHMSPLVQTPALRTVGNIVTGDDQQTQVIIQCGALPNLLNLCSHTKKAIRKETLWTISNITAGNKDQIEEVIKAGLIPHVVQALSSGDFDIKKEAAWAISNAVSSGQPPQIQYLVEQNCIKPLCDLLSVNDSRVIGVAMDAIQNILKNGAEASGHADNPYTAHIEQADGVTKLEQLQTDESEEIYNKAMKILETYFATEDDDPVDMSEAMQGTGGFQWCPPPPQGGFNFGAPTIGGSGYPQA